MTYGRDDPLEVNLYVDGRLVNELSDYVGLVADSGVSPLSIGLARPVQDEWDDFEGAAWNHLSYQSTSNQSSYQ